MTTITLNTYIQAPQQRVFDLSRSIDLHKISTQHTQEEAISGTTTGLIGLNETVTWKAKHLGVTQKLTTKITSFQSPDSFTDEMTQGAFRSMKHQHLFKKHESGTMMIDIFEFSSPFGPLGRLVNFLFLRNYMTQLLVKRNQIIKEFAETEKWRQVI
ncbi:SRPBCC family protein [Fulvivirga ligni]|uniref:SRPBCC family protein n=1 Tax=Fulvivirga ligni TaxID=2904246 RepID=UPI001F38E3B8|nr:SRPBCC family protein [Fulvivirga ligni]UII20207.1 SRPBCC family protein [Fulvivirga ligni]